MVKRRSFNVALVLLLILLLAGVLRINNLGGESLWVDEIASIRVINRSLPEILTEGHTDEKPPLYFLMLKGWVSLVGESPVALRLPSVVLGIAAVGVLFLVGAELRDTNLGLVAAFIATISYFLIRYSQEARMYSLLVLLSSLSYYFFIRLIRRGGEGRAAAGYAASTAMLLYTHYHAGFLVLAQLCTMIALWRGLEKVRFRWLAAVAVAVLAFSPWLSTLWTHMQIVASSDSWWVPVPTIFHLAGVLCYWVTFPWGSYVDPHSEHVLKALELFPLLPLVVLYLGLLVAGCFEWARRPSSRTGRLLFRPIGRAPTEETVILAVWLIVPIVVPFVLSHIGRSVFWPRYLIGVAPAFYLLVARGVVAFNHRRLAWSISLAILILTVPGLVRYYRVPMKEQVDRAARMVEREGREGDFVVLASSYPGITFRHYYHGSLGHLTVNDRDGPHKVLRQLKTAINGRKRLWLIVSKARRETAVRALHALLPEGPTAEHRFVGVKILLYDVPP